MIDYLKQKKTAYHSVYKKFTAFKMYSTQLSVVFSTIGEYGIWFSSYCSIDTIEQLEEHLRKAAPWNVGLCNQKWDSDFWFFTKLCTLPAQTWMSDNGSNPAISFDRNPSSEMTLALFSYHQYKIARLGLSSSSFFLSNL
jgi:hypothetical protein